MTTILIIAGILLGLLLAGLVGAGAFFVGTKHGITIVTNLVHKTQLEHLNKLILKQQGVSEDRKIN